jgi:hypothetical protein
VGTLIVMSTAGAQDGRDEECAAAWPVWCRRRGRQQRLPDPDVRFLIATGLAEMRAVFRIPARHQSDLIVNADLPADLVAAQIWQAINGQPIHNS